MLYTTRGTKNPKLILDGYEFVCERRSKDKAFWRCNFYSKTKCRSRLKTSGSTVRITTPAHNHKPDINLYKTTDLLPILAEIVQS